MKRSWLGLGFLVLLLVLSLLTTSAMSRIHEDSAEKLEKAADLALTEQWPQVAWLTAQVRTSWDKWELLRAALADHGPIEDLEADFALLEVYGRSREKLAFAATCREMARRMEAMGDAHGFDLKNIL